MNKPIRTMSIFCMLLFAALLLNSTYLQYFEASSLNSRGDNKRVRDAEFSRKRGAIVAGGTSVAESIPVDDPYKYQRVYKQPRKYAQLTGYFSYIYGRRSSPARTTSSRAATPCSSSNASSTCSATASPRAARCR